MNDDTRYSKLFEGQPGSVLGSFRSEPEETRAGFVTSKKKAAEEKRLPPRRNHGNRVPPGQEIVTDWPVLDLGHQPLVPTEQWSLDIKGAVGRQVSLNWDPFNSIPQSKIKADIHCVTAWSMLDNVWESVTARHLMQLVQPRDTVKHVIFHAHDGYRSNIDMSRFTEDNSLLAHSWNGNPITREHGGPIRAVIPSLYFWKSAKWIRQITFLEHDVKGYWEGFGYHNEGDPWKEQRYA